MGSDSSKPRRVDSYEREKPKDRADWAILCRFASYCFILFRNQEDCFSCRCLKKGNDSDKASIRV